MTIENISHYSFFDLQNPQEAMEELKTFLYGVPVKGTFLIATEGLNFNVSVPKDWNFSEKFMPLLKKWGCEEFDFHYSYTDIHPFRRLRLLLKSEIVSLRAGPVNVKKNKGVHITPEKFSEIIKEHHELGDESPYCLVDMRNDFEYALGSFKGAKAAGTKTFREFQHTLDRYPKDKKILMFCTGGVRCEKASAFMKENGFPEVYQLEGGILRYLSEKGTDDWEGQCFVFDRRRSVVEV